MLHLARNFCLEKRQCEEYDTSINPEWPRKAGQRLTGHCPFQYWTSGYQMKVLRARIKANKSMCFFMKSMVDTWESLLEVTVDATKYIWKRAFWGAIKCSISSLGSPRI